MQQSRFKLKGDISSIDAETQLLNRMFLEAIRIGANEIQIDKVPSRVLIHISLLANGEIKQQSISNAIESWEHLQLLKESYKDHGIRFSLDEVLNDFLSHWIAPQDFIATLQSATVKEYQLFFESHSAEDNNIKIKIGSTC